MIMICALMVALNQPPILYSVPSAIIPYERLLQYEPEFRSWLALHQYTKTPLTDFIKDRTQSYKLRQKAFQVKKKLNGRY